ncbi:SMAD/FHA domain-containing protein, partial [Parasitella parasitica]
MYHVFTAMLAVSRIPNTKASAENSEFQLNIADLKPGCVVKFGRRVDGSPIDVSFNSNVVSRSHCEISMDDDKKVYLKDIGSSTGTFLNDKKLEIGQPAEICQNDIVQLGMDAGAHKAVKIRIL